MAQQFTNQAQLSYRNTVISSNVVVGEITEVLTVTKTSVQDQYTTGGHVTYVVNLLNSGSTALTGLTLTDDLGSFTDDTGTYVPLTYTDGTLLVFINGVLQPAPTITETDPLTVTGLTVPAGGETTLVYETEVNEYASPISGSEITNTVTVSGGGLYPTSASATVDAASGPILSIEKTVSPIPVVENGRITYTLLVRNTGNAEATVADNLSITDTFDPALSNLTVSYNGTVWNVDTNYTYDETTGLFTTVPGQITVPAATFTREADGSWIAVPGTAVVTVSGKIS